jgi:dephospho-CoA kinase
MLKVGLTGNIGGGKTTVAGIFSSLGVPVFHADMEAKKQYEYENVRKEILEKFGTVVFSPSGEILRNVLAGIVFNDPGRLTQLNNIIHPGVYKDYLEWSSQHSGFTYTLYEAAILFESGHYRDMDKVICVTAPEELRIKRVMERDHLTRREVEKRMANQWDEDRKVALADFVIKNDQGEMVIEQVIKIHNQLVQS